MFKVAERYKVQIKLADEVFLAQDENLTCENEFERLVVLKCYDFFSAAGYEETIYKSLKEAAGFPRLQWSGMWEGLQWIALDYVGCSVAYVQNRLPDCFNSRTVAALAVQMIERIKQVHSIGFVHGDIKPENFTLSPTPLRAGDHIPFINLVDFDASLKCVDEEGDKLFMPKFANPGFSSINSDAGEPLAKRDDLESLAYSLVALIRGELPPWVVEGNASAKIKRETTPEELCAGLPHIYAKFMQYARELAADVEPDYDSFITEFREASASWSEMDWDHEGVVSVQSSFIHQKLC